MCPLCFRPPPGPQTFTESDLCAEHGTIMAHAAESKQRHQEHGGCWDGCGCIDFDELDRQLAEGSGFASPHKGRGV